MKVAIIHIDPFLIAQMFRQGTRIITPEGREVVISKGVVGPCEADGGGYPMFYDPFRNDFQVRVRSEAFEDVPYGSMPPDLVVEMTTVNTEPVEVLTAGGAG